MHLRGVDIVWSIEPLKRATTDYFMAFLLVYRYLRYDNVPHIREMLAGLLEKQNLSFVGGEILSFPHIR